jgi:hypothetical protein
METDDGDMAVGKLEKLTSLSGLAQVVLPHARFQKQHGFSPGCCIGFGKDGECIIHM